MSNDPLFTISKNEQGMFKDRGSKFLSFLYKVSTEEEIQEAISEIKQLYPDASHHCVAWRISPSHPIDFSSDDGEPSGSAGLPILNTLRSFSLINVLAVVVRYYGGTKLGKSGLIYAYAEAVKNALFEAPLISVERRISLSLTFPYDWHGTADQLIRSFSILVEKSTYTDQVYHEWLIKPLYKESILNQIMNAQHLGVHLEINDEQWVEIFPPSK